MLPSLGPAVAAAPLLVRVAAYTTLWVAHSFVIQTLIWGVLELYRRAGWVKKNTRGPQLPFHRMLWADLVGYYSWMVVAGAVHAWYNPSWDSWSYNFNYSMWFWYQLPICIAYDTWFFHVHRYMHTNKWLFRHIHSRHHAHEAYLNVMSNSFEHPIDGLMVVGIPAGLMAWLGCWVGNWWAVMVPLHTLGCFLLFGHCGYDLELIEPKDIVFLAINPIMLVLFVSPNKALPVDHEEHHTNPRVNYGAFFTFWDDLYDCAHAKHNPVKLSTFVVGLLFYAPVVAYYEWVLLHTRSFVIALGLQLLTPLPRVAYEYLGGAAARFVTHLGIWDRLREDQMVSYAEPGAPGAFEADASRRYIFCYQPMGIQARGAWYTFAGKGRKSPVAALRGVKLSVGRWLWGVPVAQQAMALYDCCDSSYATLKELLTTEVPQSVCIPIGGFRESRYLMTHSVVARCRRGFARLAGETGAALVPVLGIGESFVCGEFTMMARVLKLLATFRPYPLKVVFGRPLEPQPGESADALHQRYCDELLRLAKQHDVPLRIVE